MIQPFDATGVVRGPDGVLRYEGLERSLVEMLRRTVERVPDRPAICEIDGARVSYRELWDRSASVAGGLREMGVTRGDRVANCLPNGLDWCIAFLGSLMAGAIAVPVNTRFAKPEIDYVLEDSGAKHLFAAGRPLPIGEPYVAEDLAPSDIASIFYTSGTTGQPKGAMTTHENFLSNVETVMRTVLLGAGQAIRTLISVPLFHVTGCNSQLLPMLRLGGLAVILPEFSIGRLLAAISEYEVDALIATPAIYWLLLRQPDLAAGDLSRVRWVMYGGAPISPEQVAEMMDAFPNARLGNAYGLTETSSVATFLPHELCRDRPDTVGLPAPNCEVRIGGGGDGGAGELLIRSSQVVAGYWRKERQTGRTIVDGWLHTGDVARIDDEGFVSIVDRMKDVINRGGENVYSIEVENAIASFPAVAEVAVVGVADQMMGEKVAALVVPHEGAHVDRDELLDFLAERIADFKLPEYLVVQREPLPRNPGGKVIKHTVRSGTQWGDPLPRRRARRS